jgi:hypothetical protein
MPTSFQEEEAMRSWFLLYRAQLEEQDRLRAEVESIPEPELEVEVTLSSPRRDMSDRNQRRGRGLCIERRRDLSECPPSCPCRIAEVDVHLEDQREGECSDSVGE